MSYIVDMLQFKPYRVSGPFYSRNYMFRSLVSDLAYTISD